MWSQTTLSTPTQIPLWILPMHLFKAWDCSVTGSYLLVELYQTARKSCYLPKSFYTSSLLLVSSSLNHANCAIFPERTGENARCPLRDSRRRPPCYRYMSAAVNGNVRGWLGQTLLESWRERSRVKSLITQGSETFSDAVIVVDCGSNEIWSLQLDCSNGVVEFRIEGPFVGITMGHSIGNNELCYTYMCQGSWITPNTQ